MASHVLSLSVVISVVSPAHAGVMSWFKDTFGDKDVHVIVEGHEWQRAIRREIRKVGTFHNWRDVMLKLDEKEHWDDACVQKERSVKKVELRTATDGNKYTFREYRDYYAPEKRTADNGEAYTWTEFAEYYGKKGGIATEIWEAAKSVPHPDWLDDEWAKLDTKCEGECCPLCGNETVWDDWCDYQGFEWKPHGDAKSSGSDAYPYWPESGVTGCLEAECLRETSRVGTYKLKLTEIDQEGTKTPTHCTTEQGGWSLAQWRRMTTGFRSDVKRRIGYGILCGSIKVPAQGGLINGEEMRKASDGKAYSLAEFVEFYGKDGFQRFEAAPIVRDEM